MTVNANTRRIVELLQQKPPLKHVEIAKQVGVDRRRVYQVQKYLEENGGYREFDPGKLVWFRSRRGWSLRELARRAEVNVSQISRWETKKASPWMPQWRKLATALGVRPEDLSKR